MWSLEDDRVVPIEPSRGAIYHCPTGHGAIRYYNVSAWDQRTIPTTITCTCHTVATISPEHLEYTKNAPDANPSRESKTPWDQLMERRTIPELKVILAEALEDLRTKPYSLRRIV